MLHASLTIQKYVHIQIIWPNRLCCTLSAFGIPCWSHSIKWKRPFSCLIAQFFSRQEMKGLLLKLMLSCQTSNLKFSHHQPANYVKKRYCIYDGNTWISCISTANWNECIVYDSQSLFLAQHKQLGKRPERGYRPEFLRPFSLLLK